ncbi:MAG: hypothetical protein ACJAXJ_000516 [Colwellia sp.]|jgi:hypothetical protein
MMDTVRKKKMNNIILKSRLNIWLLSNINSSKVWHIMQKFTDNSAYQTGSYQIDITALKQEQ